MDTIELADGGILLYHGAFLPPDLADRYFVELRDTSAWEQKKAAFGYLQPRLTASYGDEGVTYFYSGTENRALPWTPMLLEIKRRIEAVRGRYNYCLLNRYRSGADSVGLHADNEPGMGNVIGSLSLGATRTFRIRHNRTKETRLFKAIPGGPRHAYHHDWNHAAVLEARNPEDHAERGRANQSDVPNDRRGVAVEVVEWSQNGSCR